MSWIRIKIPAANAVFPFTLRVDADSFPSSFSFSGLLHLLPAFRTMAVPKVGFHSLPDILGVVLNTICLRHGES